MAWRETLQLILSDPLAATHEFINAELSRSGLARCLKRHQVCSLRTLQKQTEEQQSQTYSIFKDNALDFVHVDIKHLSMMPEQRTRSYLL